MENILRLRPQLLSWEYQARVHHGDPKASFKPDPDWCVPEACYIVTRWNNMANQQCWRPLLIFDIYSLGTIPL